MQFLYSAVLYIAIPLMLIFTRSVDVNIHRTVGAGAMVIGISIYVHFIACYLMPGACSLLDIITDSFVSQRMNFISGYIDKSKWLIFNREKRKVGNLSVNEYCFFKIVFAIQNRKAVFATTYFYHMDANKCYTVKYGKFSKVITSILSEEGDEMLQFDL
jgi:hypothetical protein